MKSFPAILATVLLCWSCARAPLAATHLVLVTLDTTRVDRIGAYGREGAGTPWLDGLAARGIRFGRAYSHVPLTLPSHVTIFTGLYPTHHGVHLNGQTSMQAGIRTLAEILAASGFYTAAAVGGYPVSSRFPVHRGFERFDDRFPATDSGIALERDAASVVRAALGALEGRGERRVFLWVHLYDPHDPYAPPAAFRDRFPADPYQGEIAAVDAALADLSRGIEQILGKDVLFCVVADHGEALGEHGEDTHGYFLYEATVRVPFFIAGPGVPQHQVLDTPVGTADVLPTLLRGLGLPVPEGLDGRAIDVKGSSPQERQYLETELPASNYGFAPLHGVVDGRWKYVAAPRPELYDLREDPSEGHDLSREDADRLRDLHAWVSGIAPSGPITEAPVDPRLASLGYIGFMPGPAGSSGALDPKDGLPIYRDFQAASRALEEGDPAAAMPALDRLLRQADVPGVRFKRAVAHRLLGDWVAAERELQRVAESMPGFPGLEMERTLVAVGRQDWRSVASHAEAQLRIEPRDPQALVFRGAAKEFLGDPEAAEADYRSALSVDPGIRNASLRLASLLVRSGRVPQARVVLQEHLRLHPGDSLASGLLSSL